ncbi:adenylate/guanylate cyclase [Tistlia consotensis]|uniref:Adenylate/guanylate cyclase n=1 Tax=Tistlia consotensis USBA 355 TaxID=560819 RepID=A0A1Y6BJP4_9PROT|nr:adenylate/guanylate cyclase domain-containing protein [Tistlia consotensis]SMF14578.1 adenylate/guanylate cyclase [Tistlia consotensis USBA 355]SNR49420.1 adenylate/guanylate cyclase [Tistlia consotensis]
MRRRRWPVLASGLIALAAMVCLRVLDPAPIQALRLRAFDLYQRTEPRPYRPVPVTVLDIDEAALAAEGQWPWPRSTVALMVERLRALDAAAIAFDILFSEPDRTSPRQLLRDLPDTPEGAALAERLRALPDHDEQLAAAMASAPTVAAVALFHGAEGNPESPPQKAGFAFAGSDPAGFLPRYRGALRDLPPIERAASGLGSITFDPDFDGVVRRLPLLQVLGTAILPSLSVEALRVAQGASTLIARSADASGALGLAESGGLSAIKVGRFVVPTTAEGALWLWYHGPLEGRRLSAAGLLGDGWADLRPAVEGRILLVGTSAQGLRDQRATPLSGSVAGVEIHAEALEQMLAGTFLTRPDWAEGAEIVALVLLGLLFVLLLPLAGALWCALLGVLAVGAGLAASWLAFSRAHFLLDPVYPALAAFVVYLTVTTLRYALSERERDRVRGAFSRYLAPALVERLAERPQALKLGGESREITVLFADIRGFTTLSERLTPEELTACLNRFLTPMTDALLAEGATIDKYIGDAIMAFWNAPLDQPDHPRRALRGALAMRRRLAELAPRWAEEDAAAGREPIEIRIGIGLNSGPCVVGNLGSEQRFDYSALGDTVNLTSRLEGMSKVYRVDILVGEDTALQAAGFALVELDRVRVVGRAHPVAVFAALGDESLAADPDFQALKARHEAALAAYRAGAWDEAEAAFGALRDTTDPLLRSVCPVFLERIAAFRGAPPAADWDGVFRAEHK